MITISTNRGKKADAYNNTGDRIIWFMLCIYPMLVIPCQLGYFYMPRYIVLATLSIVSLPIVARKFKIKNIRLVPLALFILFTLISTLLASHSATAFMGLYGYKFITLYTPETVNLFIESNRFTGFSTYIFCVIMFILASINTNREKLIKYMIITSAVVGFIAVLQFFSLNIVPHELSRIGAYGTIGNPNFLATYMVFLLPAAILKYIEKGNNYWVLSIALIYAGLIVSMTRGAWIAFAIVFSYILIHFIIKRQERRRLVIVIIALTLVTLILIVEDYNIVSRAKSISENVVAGANLQDSAGSNRIFIWKEIMKLFPKCWAFGMGPDHLIYANIPLGTGLVDKAHNIYLEMLITLGAFALISYLVFIIGIIELSAKKNSIMYRLMIISYLLQGFFNIDVIMVLPLFWIILGFALSEGTEKINNTICACETSL